MPRKTREYPALSNALVEWHLRGGRLNESNSPPEVESSVAPEHRRDDSNATWFSTVASSVMPEGAASHRVREASEFEYLAVKPCIIGDEHEGRTTLIFNMGRQYGEVSNIEKILNVGYMPYFKFSLKCDDGKIVPYYIPGPDGREQVENIHDLLDAARNSKERIGVLQESEGGRVHFGIATRRCCTNHIA